MLKITGLDEIAKQLDKIADNIEKVSGTHQVSMEELLSSEFIAAHTKFATLDDFFEAGGFEFANSEEFDAIPVEKLDEFVRSASTFDSWSDLTGEAAKAWTQRKLRGS